MFRVLGGSGIHVEPIDVLYPEQTVQGFLGEGLGTSGALGGSRGLSK